MKFKKMISTAIICTILVAPTNGFAHNLNKKGYLQNGESEFKGKIKITRSVEVVNIKVHNKTDRGIYFDVVDKDGNLVKSDVIYTYNQGKVEKEFNLPKGTYYLKAYGNKKSNGVFKVDLQTKKMKIK